MASFALVVAIVAFGIWVALLIGITVNGGKK
jgi:hypothetical protein